MSLKLMMMVTDCRFFLIILTITNVNVNDISHRSTFKIIVRKKELEFLIFVLACLIYCCELAPIDLVNSMNKLTIDSLYKLYNHLRSFHHRIRCVNKNLGAKARIWRIKCGEFDGDAPLLCNSITWANHHNNNKLAMFTIWSQDL